MDVGWAADRLAAVERLLDEAAPQLQRRLDAAGDLPVAEIGQVAQPALAQREQAARLDQQARAVGDVAADEQPEELGVGERGGPDERETLSQRLRAHDETGPKQKPCRAQAREMSRATSRDCPAAGRRSVFRTT